MSRSDASFLNTTSDMQSSYPFYYVDRPTLLKIMSDKTLSLLSPVIVFWTISISFHILDEWSPPFLEKYRIHVSKEVASKNRASKLQVVITVFFQQLLMTSLGYFWTEDQQISTTDHIQEIHKIQNLISHYLSGVVGRTNTASLLGAAGPQLYPWLYWWGIPALQFMWAFFIVDTWQYLLHRIMHTVPFLYKHFHAWHHRLYVPYAYGGLYNHPVEGVLGDIVGALLSADLTRMTPRQNMIMFGLAVAKTVHDHCGWSLPWDPMQFLFANNADYHDIHHQHIGVKSNYSQPFFVYWDSILGTKMTRREFEERKRIVRSKTA